jgi:hypothetical protein
MLVRTQAGYVNLLTISEAELREDGSVSLCWGKHSKRYTGPDAAALRAALERMAGSAFVSKEAPPAGPREDEPPMTPVLKFVPQQEQRASLFDEEALAPVVAAVAEEVEEPPAHDSALTRRVAQVLDYEPLASLTPKHREAFLGAVEKASDFANLAPRYRKMLEQAETARRRDERQ